MGKAAIDDAVLGLRASVQQAQTALESLAQREANKEQDDTSLQDAAKALETALNRMAAASTKALRSTRPASAGSDGARKRRRESKQEEDEDEGEDSQDFKISEWTPPPLSSNKKDVRDWEGYVKNLLRLTTEELARAAAQAERRALDEEFLKVYIRDVTENFGEELDRVRVSEPDAHRLVARLVGALTAGGTSAAVFDDVAKRVYVKSMKPVASGAVKTSSAPAAKADRAQESESESPEKKKKKRSKASDEDA